MASSAISSSSVSSTYFKSKFSTRTSYCPQLSSQSRISFNSTNFSKSSFPQILKKTHSKSAPIKASRSDAVCVNTESYYELLGISENDSIKEIKKAYKQLARKYHPDVSPAGKKEEYTKKFIQVQEAYETLSDPNSRASYDRDMSSGLGLHANFSARSRRYESRTDDNMEDWEQRWQSQLSDLIRKSNSKDFQNSTASTWGDRMRSRKSFSN